MKGIPREAIERKLESVLKEEPRYALLSEEEREVLREFGCRTFEYVYDALENERRETLDQVLKIVDLWIHQDGNPQVLRALLERFRDQA